jgi:hypothetical protein
MSQNYRTAPRIDARWMKPGVDPADVIPALARGRAQKEAARERARAAEGAALDAEIEDVRRVQAALNEEMKEVNAEMARRRRLWKEAKYSPDQPRIPKRNPGGGQWTRVGGGGGQSPSTNIAKPMGTVDAGNLSGSRARRRGCSTSRQRTTALMAYSLQLISTRSAAMESP